MSRDHLIPDSQRSGPTPSSTDALKYAAADHLIHNLRGATCRRERGEDEYSGNGRVFTAENIAQLRPYNDHA